MPKIPPKNNDLRRYVLRRDAFRILGFLLWLALLIGGAVSYNNEHQTYPDHRRIVGWRMVLWVAIAVLTGFFIFRIWRFWTDRTSCGVIESTGLSHTYTPSGDPRTSGMDYDFRTNTAIRLHLDNGRRKRMRFEQKQGFYQYYYEGNRIVRFHGLPYPINLDPESKNGYVCAACGYWTKKYLPTCELCGHSMIDPKDLR